MIDATNEYRIVWKDGREETTKAVNLAQAVLALGYGTDDFGRIEHWESIQQEDTDYVDE